MRTNCIRVISTPTPQLSKGRPSIGSTSLWSTLLTHLRPGAPNTTHHTGGPRGGPQGGPVYRGSKGNGKGGALSTTSPTKGGAYVTGGGGGNVKGVQQPITAQLSDDDYDDDQWRIPYVLGVLGVCWGFGEKYTCIDNTSTHTSTHRTLGIHAGGRGVHQKTISPEVQQERTRVLTMHDMSNVCIVCVCCM